MDTFVIALIAVLITPQTVSSLRVGLYFGHFVFPVSSTVLDTAYVLYEFLLSKWINGLRQFEVNHQLTYMGWEERKHWIVGGTCIYIHKNVLSANKSYLNNYSKIHTFTWKKGKHAESDFTGSLQILYIWLTCNSHHDDPLWIGFYMLNLDSCWWTNAHFKLLK